MKDVLSVMYLYDIDHRSQISYVPVRYGMINYPRTVSVICTYIFIVLRATCYGYVLRATYCIFILLYRIEQRYRTVRAHYSLR